MNRLLPIFLITAALAGCATIEPVAPRVVVNSTTYQGPNHLERGTLAVIPFTEAQNGSLEFQTVSNLLAAELSTKGYTTSPISEKPQFVAYITYGIDNGKTSTTSVPIYGQVGGGTSFTTGSVRSSTGAFGSYNATTTSMPTYGVVGASNVSETQFKREVNVDIFKVTGEKPVKVYEVRGVSSGSCGNIRAVLPAILKGMFQAFPSENGKSKTSEVAWDAQC